MNFDNKTAIHSNTHHFVYHESTKFFTAKRQKNNSASIDTELRFCCKLNYLSSASAPASVRVLTMPSATSLG